MDMTNITSSEDLIKTYGKSHIDTRSASGCSQGNCPDNSVWDDLIFQYTVIEQPGIGGAPPIPLVTQEWHGRWKGCDQCGRVKTSEDGCFGFTACGDDQSICIDHRQRRMHHIWNKSGKKLCYAINSDSLGDCGFVQATLLYWPTKEIKCTW